ncbi:MAG: DUF4359 domain-containing protein [Desmonostoc vinosum HA7617-LM4]|nr:DUF4359 domain-containing protein [Desmonostoc vinosum HA7617-LM4]
MKASNIIAYAGAAGLVVLGVASATTNPSQAQYEEYAVQRLTAYLKTDFCDKTPKILEKFIDFKCNQLIDSANPHIQKIIAGTTESKNYLLFTIYRTNLKIDSWIPTYKFETVGAFNNFYTYTAEQQ